MKLAGLNLLFFVVAGSLAAQTPKPAPAKTSARLTQEIRATLPKFAAPIAGTPGTTGSTPPDPNVLVLPTVTVKEKQPPWLKLSEHLTDLARKEKFARDFVNSLEGLEAVPFFAPPIGERIRAAYEAQQKEEFNSLSNAIKQVDPKASTQLRKDYQNMKDTEDWLARPAGSGRIK